MCACQTQTQTDKLASGYGKLRHQLQMRAKQDPRHVCCPSQVFIAKQGCCVRGGGRISKQKVGLVIYTRSWGWCRDNASVAHYRHTPQHAHGNQGSAAQCTGRWLRGLGVQGRAATEGQQVESYCCLGLLCLPVSDVLGDRGRKNGVTTMTAV